MLHTLLSLLAANVLFTPLSRRAGFGNVLGYLIGGIIIGPAGLRLVTDVDDIREIAELGIVMLLFLIGLELRPRRLWIMRKTVFGLGVGQLLLTGAVLLPLVHLAGPGWTGALVVAAGLALSSTAIVLPLLAERDLLATTAGRDAFSVLLFQDLSFIPMVALVPLVTGEGLPLDDPWIQVARGILGIVVILLGGRFFIRPVFRLIGASRTPETFTALALLIVVGAAAIALGAGLSASLGAFLGGVLLSDSEFRHELQADIEPFEGLLLGFFFISVGMSANLDLLLTDPATIGLGLLVMTIVKIVVAFALGRLRGGDMQASIRFALSLSQGSEFSFVLFATAVGAGVLSTPLANQLTLIIALSMLTTPVLFSLSECFLIPRFEPARKPVYDKVFDEESSVIICGFGRVGQIVGRILAMKNIPFTALEKDEEQVEFVRRYGTKVYYGDPGRLDVLRAAGAERAKLLVVALADMEETLKVVDMAREAFPNLKILARARNRRHHHLLMDRNIDGIVRETYHSSLVLSRMVLKTLGVAAKEAERTVDFFRQHDEKVLVETHAFYEDERQLIQTAQQTREELMELFSRDLGASEKQRDTGKNPEGVRVPKQAG